LQDFFLSRSPPILHCVALRCQRGISFHVALRCLQRDRPYRGTHDRRSLNNFSFANGDLPIQFLGNHRVKFAVVPNAGAIFVGHLGRPRRLPDLPLTNWPDFGGFHIRQALRLLLPCSVYPSFCASSRRRRTFSFPFDDFKRLAGRSNRRLTGGMSSSLASEASRGAPSPAASNTISISPRVTRSFRRRSQDRWVSGVRWPRPPDPSRR
jgi:hypothetical protein